MMFFTRCAAAAVLALVAAAAEAQVPGHMLPRGALITASDFDGPYGAPEATFVRSWPPRPPAPIPHVASRAVPVPRAAPPRGEAPVAAARPVTADATPQQSAAAQPKATEAATIGQAKPAPTILPTEAMPPVQVLE